MTLLQWLVAAITSALVALVGILQWRTAQQKAVHELYNDRFRIYEVVKNCVDQVSINPGYFDSEREKEFLKAVHEAYFFFGADIHDYLETLRQALALVRDIQTNKLPKTGAFSIKHMQAMTRINNFEQVGQPKFAKYMQFSQTVPSGILPVIRQRLKSFGKWMWDEIAKFIKLF
jgi:hypothetical protein